MAWYDEAVFYHIYPLGLTGAPEKNEYSSPVSRINMLYDWIEHIKDTGFDALYIGPLCESVGHGYETTDYRQLDSRLGTNEDLKKFISHCHKNGIRVIFDGVFNHTGRDFFAFRDILQNRENSPYKGWYNVNFWGNNSYNDGFSYENWGGYDLLVKLNQKNPEVINYICDVIRYWASEFDIDGIRLDAADVLDFDFMKALRRTANEVKSDFWLMGEVIHGDYSRWANSDTLHSVTNYTLHKALYSGHNDRNYFEIAHTIKRNSDMCRNLKLYNFSDNHDVERIYTKLTDKRHIVPVNILLFTLPGIPSVYYGSEFMVEGRKERHSDASLRPYLNYEELKDSIKENPVTRLTSVLIKIKKEFRELSYGAYKEVLLTNRQFAFSRTLGESSVFVAVNNDDKESVISFPAEGTYKKALSGTTVQSENGRITLTLSGNSGEILVPENGTARDLTPVNATIDIPVKEEKQNIIREEIKSEIKKEEPVPCESRETADPEKITIPDKPYEEMTVKELQAVILSKMAKNGPVTDRMKKDVTDNIWHNSLVNWAKSFR